MHADNGTEGIRFSTSDILPTVYAELRAVAKQRCSRLPPGQTMTPTALVHEVWLRLEASSGGPWVNRAQFFAAVGTLMRNILVDRLRQKTSVKSGGGRQRKGLSEHVEANSRAPEDAEAIHESLTVLEAEDPRAAQLVTLRFFVGMTLEEAADAMGVSPRTARRDWAYARAWLHRHLCDDTSI